MGLKEALCCNCCPKNKSCRIVCKRKINVQNETCGLCYEVKKELSPKSSKIKNRQFNSILGLKISQWR